MINRQHRNVKLISLLPLTASGTLYIELPADVNVNVPFAAFREETRNERAI
jgi:hypothetical protein